MPTAADEVTHYVTARPVLNGPRYHVRYQGRVYGQHMLTCPCGWSTVCIAQLTEVYTRRHVAEAEKAGTSS